GDAQIRLGGGLAAELVAADAGRPIVEDAVAVQVLRDARAEDHVARAGVDNAGDLNVPGQGEGAVHHHRVALVVCGGPPVRTDVELIRPLRAEGGGVAV